MSWEDFQMFRKITTRRKKKKEPSHGHGSKRMLSALLRSLTSRKQLTEEDQDSVFDATIEKVLEAVQAQAITVYLIDHDAGEIEFKYSYSSPTLWGDDQDLRAKYEQQQENIRGMRIPIGKGIVGKVIDEQKSYVSIDAQNDPHFFGDVADPETGFQTHSMITVPIETEHGVIGAIQVINKDSFSGVPFFTREDVQLLEEVADYSSKVVQKVHDPDFLLDDEEVAFYISKMTNYKYMKLEDDFELNDKLVELVTRELIEELQIVPYEKTGESTLSVFMANPMEWQKKENFQVKTGMKISDIFVVSASKVKGILDGFKKLDTGIGEAAGLVRDEYKTAGAEAISVEDGVDEDSAPIVQLANRIIEDAYVQGASDIHIEPQEDGILVRYRVDGVLAEKLNLPKSSQKPLVARLKIMSELDIAERRLPQDGRIVFKKHTRKNIDVDLRVSTGPMNFGEKVCMRILDKSKSALPLNKLGYSEHNLGIYREILKEPYGMILHTGPTGSGKSMTLYSALGEIVTPKINIQTAEDPIEYTLKGINQMQMKREIGLTFANALRCFLRQDPDVILVGEIRDTETAEIAIEAALTGHLLFSTLHTNDAATTITRFTEMGIEPFMISSSLLCACAQRLLRRLCKCKAPYEPDDRERKLAQIPDDFQGTIYKKKGCNRCGGSGYKGRTGTHELLIINDEIRDLVNKRATAIEIKKLCVEQGMRTLHDDSMLKVREGITSVEEALRVVKVDETRGEELAKLAEEKEEVASSAGS
jgi:type IV pilus assembly protein PilB